MFIIVPLAGPDFIGSDGSIKALIEVDRQPLLLRTLRSRPWMRSAEGQAATILIFILQDRVETRDFADQYLRVWFPDCRICFISHVAAGAAMSALAAVAMVDDFSAPLCLDLADIGFTADLSPSQLFATDPSLGGIAVTFPSDRPHYSYLELDEEARMVKAREKIVISDNASAGVYFFSSAEVYLSSVAYLVEQRQELAHNNLLFVCPVLNGVVAQGLTVRAVECRDVVDIKCVA